MPFPTTPILDTFNRADANPIGGNWTAVFQNLKIVSNVIASTNAADAGVCGWNPNTFSPNSEAYLTLSTAGASTDSVAVYARMSTNVLATANGYQSKSLNGTAYIQRLDLGTATQIASTTQSMSSGDKIGISCEGSVIYHHYCSSGGSWTPILQVTDSTYSSGGYLWARVDSSIMRGDDFGGGPSGSAPITAILDTFNRADEDPATGYTLIDTVDVAIRIVSNQAVQGTTGTFWSGGWNATQFGTNQEIYVTVPTLGTGLNLYLCQPVLNSSTKQNYSAKMTFGSTVYLRRSDAGTNTTLASTTFSFSAGDKAWLRRLGTALEVYRYTGGAWLNLLSATDSTYLTPGYLGLGFYGSTVVDDLGGGSARTHRQMLKGVR